MSADDHLPAKEGWTRELLAQRRKNAIVMALVLAGFVVLFFFAALARLKVG